ncbi:MarR family transcriptional regulator [Actinoplanes sp. TRM 88003]|uniref:MarR family transcriptional regulator n=1 Tax=Paractinoplanes aksuensis TaxID=2939490 RepID=A0ABT1DXL9_9ACTN|nr:MarR family transcriptional regulator [Actinoplanes aksuensis]MCO8275527.1 MarR family transcriptional regulator [Actinoplanes aksuensis]
MNTAVVPDPGGDLLSPPEEQFFNLFLSAAAAVHRRVSADLVRDHSITLSDYRALRSLDVAPDRRMRLQALADASFLSRSRISRMVRTFERRGLVLRERAEDDGRGWYVNLTPAGQSWLTYFAHSYALSIRRHVLSALDPAAVRAVTAAAQRLV